MKSALRLISPLLVLVCIPSLPLFAFGGMSALQETSGTGVGVGMIAALSFPPFPNKYSYAPVALACLLLVIAWRNEPASARCSASPEEKKSAASHCG
jgi:hypothetical protein